MKPSFACIGAHKAGTTWLYEQLAAHPEFAMPPLKEFHYFDRDESYPSPNSLSKTTLKSRISDFFWLANSTKVILNSYRRHNLDVAKWYTRFYFSNYSDHWYLSMFDFAKGKITGDITPSYSILNDTDVARMRHVIGDAKIIYFLRNPIDRAWSTLRYDKSRGRTLDLDNILSLKRYIDSPSQELRSNYERTLEIYCRHFDEKQILVGFYDAISNQPKELMSAVLHHLGAKNTSPTMSKIKARVNSSPSIEMPTAIREYLSEKYRPSIEQLAARLGSYATLWLKQIDGNMSENIHHYEQFPAATYL